MTVQSVASALPADELARLERRRDDDLARNRQTAAIKRASRARLVRNCLQIVPGESVLVFAAGNCAWAYFMASVLDGRNPVTAVSFSAPAEPDKTTPAGVKVVSQERIADIARESFDYVVGTHVLSAGTCGASLFAMFRWLKPGGQLLLLEPNDDGPWQWRSAAADRLPKARLMRELAKCGFVESHIQAYDIVPDALA